MQMSASVKPAIWGRSWRSSRRHYCRFQLGRVGNRRDGQKDGDDQCPGCHRAGAYAGLRRCRRQANDSTYRGMRASDAVRV
jgi:hypothetical protein